MSRFKFVATLSSIVVWSTLAMSYTPVVMYHGMGDTAHGSIESIKKYLESQLPGIYVTSIQMGNTTEEDFLSSFFMNLNTQVSKACEMIRNDPKLKNGYNALGFSQGGQIIRAIAQRCPDPPMLNLISFGGQHQGVFGLPRCLGYHYICDYIRRMLNFGAYWRFVQEKIVQAEYWHDPLQYETYRNKSIFLADINNEREPRNQTYKENLLKLKNMVLVMFLNDTIVQPRDSGWFGFYAPGQDQQLVDFRNTSLYKEDWIGLKQLDQSGRLKLLSTLGNHLQFTIEWFQENIVEAFLK